MKYLILLLANLIVLAFIDHKYNAELNRHYAETKDVINTYCVPSAILHDLMEKSYNAGQLDGLIRAEKICNVKIKF